MGSLQPVTLLTGVANVACVSIVVQETRSARATDQMTIAELKTEAAKRRENDEAGKAKVGPLLDQVHCPSPVLLSGSARGGQ